MSINRPEPERTDRIDESEYNDRIKKHKRKKHSLKDADVKVDIDYGSGKVETITIKIVFDSK